MGCSDCGQDSKEIRAKTYLISYQLYAGRQIGHINIQIDKWKDGDDTATVMNVMADRLGCLSSDIIITSVFTLPDS